MEKIEESILDRLNELVCRAKSRGVDEADAIYVHGTSLSTTHRLGQPEHLERSEGADIGLRVIIGNRQAIVSSSDISEPALEELLERGVAMAKVVPEDEFSGIAPAELLAMNVPELDECDPDTPDTKKLTDLAARTEAAALAIKGVNNSEGGDAGWSRSFIALTTSNGFSRTRVRTSFSLSAAVLAGEGTNMERDYDWATAVHFKDLPEPEEIGKRAGEQAVKRLNPRKVETAQVPIIYDPRVSQSLPSHFAAAINGAAVARGTTFLMDRMGKQVTAEGLSIIDDPLRLRGLRSKGFDGEGIPTQKRSLVEDGILLSWLLDLRSARQLGLQTTGNATRGISTPPSPSATNLYLVSGNISPKELISDVKQGFYVTEMMGQGVNIVTGDYSRGASGFWIENGEISEPVSELTIAGNLRDMFMQMSPANDLVFRYGINAPTVRVDGMTVAGK